MRPLESRHGHGPTKQGGSDGLRGGRGQHQLCRNRGRHDHPAHADVSGAGVQADGGPAAGRRREPGKPGDAVPQLRDELAGEGHALVPGVGAAEPGRAEVAGLRRGDHGQQPLVRLLGGRVPGDAGQREGARPAAGRRRPGRGRGAGPGLHGHARRAGGGDGGDEHVHRGLASGAGQGRLSGQARRQRGGAQHGPLRSAARLRRADGGQAGAGLRGQGGAVPALRARRCVAAGGPGDGGAALRPALQAQRRVRREDPLSPGGPGGHLPMASRRGAVGGLAGVRAALPRKRHGGRVPRRLAAGAAGLPGGVRPVHHRPGVPALLSRTGRTSCGASKSTRTAPSSTAWATSSSRTRRYSGSPSRATAASTWGPMRRPATGAGRARAGRSTALQRTRSSTGAPSPCASTRTAT